MKVKDFAKKVLKNLSIFILLCIVWFVLWLGFGFIGALLLWELGAFLAYKSLKKDIELINKK